MLNACISSDPKDMPLTATEIRRFKSDCQLRSPSDQIVVKKASRGKSGYDNALSGHVNLILIWGCRPTHGV